ncbi:MAG TPA: hypothetical protein VHU79_05420, partial [Sphingomicrobium sp.]|nr:hypothetical protein [Sphingomicrobium sp.]
MSSRKGITEMVATKQSAAPPCTVVIFGASGDLTKRLLVPALYNLRRAQLLLEHFALIGVARAEKDNETFRGELAEGLRKFGTNRIWPTTGDGSLSARPIPGV